MLEEYLVLLLSTFVVEFIFDFFMVLAVWHISEHLHKRILYFPELGIDAKQLLVHVVKDGSSLWDDVFIGSGLLFNVL